MDTRSLLRKPWRLPDVVTTSLLLVALATIWIAFAPVKLGGQVSYVLVNGISMEPGFHKGDLAIVRQAADYQVGDVVTYHDANMSANVIHRIIGFDGDQYLLQGDNNSWVDSYQPVRDEVVGKLWLHLPKMGKAVEWVRRPINLALSTGVIGAFMMADLSKQKPKQKGKRKDQAAGNHAESLEMALYTFGFLALVSLALAIFAFSRPVLRTADKIQYQQTGDFSYTAAGTSEVYDTGFVRSGEPVFTNLTCNLDMGFTYTLQGEQLGKIAGFQQFNAIVIDERSGWKRTFPMTSVEYFNGNTYTNHATLDLCQLQALVRSVEEKTGFRLSSYTLAIVSQVTVGGKISGQDFIDTFEPKLTFIFDSLHFYLTGDASKTGPLQMVQPGSLSSFDLVENTFQLFGLKLPIRETRLASLIGLATSLSGLGGAALFFFIAAKRDPQAIIQMKYGSILVNVSDQVLEPLLPAINVPAIDDLAKLAERQNATIMHLTRNFVHYYFLQANGTTYLYTSGK